MNNVMTADRLKAFMLQVFNGDPVDMFMQAVIEFAIYSAAVAVVFASVRPGLFSLWYRFLLWLETKGWFWKKLSDPIGFCEKLHNDRSYNVHRQDHSDRPAVDRCSEVHVIE